MTGPRPRLPLLLAFITTTLILSMLAGPASAQTTTITLPPSAPTVAAQYTSTPSFTSAILNSTNTFRKQHAAAPVSWNTSLADFATSYLAKADCVFAHSGGPDGENLAEGYPNVTAAVDAWGDERDEYDWSNPGFSEETGHFTQLVWKATTTVGCGRAFCGDNQGYFVVCEYWPRGNVEGQFQENVAPENGTDGTDGSSGSGDCKQGEVCDVAPTVVAERSLVLVAVVVALGIVVVV